MNEYELIDKVTELNKHNFPMIYFMSVHDAKDGHTQKVDDSYIIPVNFVPQGEIIGIELCTSVVKGIKND